MGFGQEKAVVHLTETRAGGSHAIVTSERTLRASPEKVRVCSLGFTRLCQEIQRADLILKQCFYLHNISSGNGNERRDTKSAWWMGTSLRGISP